jgi:hypothetical protein
LPENGRFEAIGHHAFELSKVTITADFIASTAPLMSARWRTSFGLSLRRRLQNVQSTCGDCSQIGQQPARRTTEESEELREVRET